MAKAKKIVLLERRETWRVRIGRPSFRRTCGRCLEQVEWLTVREAAVTAGMGEREIFLIAERGDVHSQEAAEGLLLICSHSLKWWRDPETHGA